MIAPDSFTNLGLAGITLAMIWFVIQYFMKTLSGRDEYLKGLIVNFQTHVEMCNSNFIRVTEHVTKVSEKNTRVIETLLKRVQQLEKNGK